MSAAKYVAAAGLAVRTNLRARGAVIARLAFYIVLLTVFSRVWAAVGTRTESVGLAMADLVWYLGLTETITLSTPFLALAIQDDVRRGDIAYQLARPYSYVWLKVAEGTGEALVRMASIVTIGWTMTWFLAGDLPSSVAGLALALPLLPLATLAMVMMQLCVGLTAFWLQDATPVHWVTQKMLFVFGGLLFPLEIYPDWLRAICAWTPFSAILHGPASLVIAGDPAAAAWAFVRLVLWVGVFAFVLERLYRRGRRILDVNGG